MMNKFNLIFIIILFGCGDKDSELSYEERIDLKVNEIIAIASESTAETVNDCETFFISGGNSCGPMFVYGKNNIDTALLYKKLSELNSLKQEHYDYMKHNGSSLGVCDLMFPDTIFLIGERCVACYKDNVNECSETAILFY